MVLLEVNVEDMRKTYILHSENCQISKGPACANQDAGQRTRWRAEMGGISTKYPAGQVKRQDDVHTGEQKWVGSAQNIHQGKSRRRTTYPLESRNGWDQHKVSTWASQEAGRRTYWRAEMGGISAKYPPGQVKRQDDIHTGERKWVGSAQSIHLGMSRGRKTYRLESGNGWDQHKVSTQETGRHTLWRPEASQISVEFTSRGKLCHNVLSGHDP
jgi:hypothetical protein